MLHVQPDTVCIINLKLTPQGCDAVRKMAILDKASEVFISRTQAVDSKWVYKRQLCLWAACSATALNEQL